MRIFERLLFALVALCLTAGAANAHFAQGIKVRTILLATEGGTVTAYVRTPLPLLFSDVLTTAQAEQRPLDTPFLYFEQIATGTRYRVSMQAVADQGDAFRARLQEAITWSQDGHELPARVTDYRVHLREPDERLESAEAARAALAEEPGTLDPDFGEAFVDYAVELPGAASDGTLQVQSAYPVLPVPDDVQIDNHIIDARGEAPVSYTREGQLEEPATIDGSLLRTVTEFIAQGVMHILEGIDHVFLVVCLALGIGARTRLFWIATAFTLGHSVTLIATFLGATPTWPWFIPAVETAIAATVLYAAVAALWRKMDSVLVIAGVGLLHGLGFSFVLGDILGRDAPNLVPALAAFNVGIEIGQLAVIAVTLAVVAGLQLVSRGATPVIRNAALAGIAAMSAWWVIERSAAVIT